MKNTAHLTVFVTLEAKVFGCAEGYSNKAAHSQQDRTRPLADIAETLRNLGKLQKFGLGQTHRTRSSFEADSQNGVPSLRVALQQWI
jgi:hypothetical protein